MQRRAVAIKTITTERLLLRPFAAADTTRAIEIVSNWNVARMLTRVAYPIDPVAQANWIAGHAAEAEAGTAFRFAITRGGRVLGCVDVDTIAEGSGSLGYWLGEDAWGQGIATEAASALVRFAFDVLDLSRLVAGRAEDNEASGRVLEKLGFRRTNERIVWSMPRKTEICEVLYERTPPS